MNIKKIVKFIFEKRFNIFEVFFLPLYVLLGKYLNLFLSLFVGCLLWFVILAVEELIEKNNE